MRVSDHVESALHICVLLAAAPANGGLPVKRLAEFHELPAASLAKQLQLLAGAGLVVGSAGRTGGYRLSRPAGEISVLDVVLAVDGATPAFRCQEIRRRGPCAARGRRYSPRCAIAQTMDGAEEAWRSSLRRTSLARLSRRVVAQVDERTLAQTTDWLQIHEREIQ